MRFEQVGRFEVFSWSIAGNETCVSVRADGMRFAFDLGFAPAPLVSADHVFISHGHADHIGAIWQHMKKRHLTHLPKATYYLPQHLVQYVRTIGEAYAAMSELGSESEFNATLVGMAPKMRIQLPNGWSVEALQTEHAVASQGYLLYQKDVDGNDRPEIAYLGDSRFSVIENAASVCPSLLSTRLLIMESTFLDRPEKHLEGARRHGHTHFEEIRKNAPLFQSVENIYLVHFSARYNAEQILRLTHTALPNWLAKRIVASTCAQRFLTMDF
ncbi:unnamed protein product [Calicophoron daubneyi]|uniref:Metallo-beta-lactamase domain-containing protein n=1 Tax=Calicophoron daubneyi TaxID=300641 RepID=A0AAV2TI87_CALDB